MSALRDFQHAFVRTLLAPQPDAVTRFGTGLAVYQNTVAQGLVEVLRANFPTVLRLVGGACFDAVALCYAREQPPRQPALALYGAGFPEFLRETAPAQWPYLSPVAELDRLWTEVHFAPDAPTQKAANLIGLSPQQLGTQTLRLHPATRIARCGHGAVTIWCANRPAAAPDELEITDMDEAVLMTRPHGQVQVEPLAVTSYEFIRQLHAGATLEMAADAALAADASVDIAALLAMLLHAGAFCGHANQFQEIMP